MSPWAWPLRSGSAAHPAPPSRAHAVRPAPAGLRTGARTRAATLAARGRPPCQPRQSALLLRQPLFLVPCSPACTPLETLTPRPGRAQVARPLRRRAAHAAPAPAARAVGARAAPQGRTHLGGLRWRAAAPALRRARGRTLRPCRMRSRCARAAAPARRPLLRAWCLAQAHLTACLPRGCQCARFMLKGPVRDARTTRALVTPARPCAGAGHLRPSAARGRRARGLLRPRGGGRARGGGGRGGAARGGARPEGGRRGGGGRRVLP